MLRWLSSCLLLPVVLGFGSGCGGSDPEPLELDEEFYRLQDCAGAGLEVAGGVFVALLDLVAAVADPDAEPPSHVIYHPDTKEFFVGADLDGDEFTEAIVEGTLATTSDIDNGLQAGESVSADWAIGIGVPVSGSGQFEVSMLSASAVRIQGTLTVSDEAACDFAIETLDLTVDAGDGPEAIPVGTIDFEVTSAPDSMSARIEFDGTRFAEVAAQYGGVQVNYTMDLETGEVVD
jgi:hypothetical protein